MMEWQEEISHQPSPLRRRPNVYPKVPAFVFQSPRSPNRPLHSTLFRISRFSAEMELNSQQPNFYKGNASRFCFRFQVEQIPGEPCARPLTLVNAFMERFHQRKFSWDDDYIYTPSNIDHDKGKAYLILDVNKQCVPKPATEDVRICCYRVAVINNIM